MIETEQRKLVALKKQLGISNPGPSMTEAVAEQTTEQQLAALHQQLELNGWRHNYTKPVGEGGVKENDDDSVTIVHDTELELWFRRPQENVLVLITKDDNGRPTAFNAFVQSTLLDPETAVAVLSKPQE